MNYFSTNVQLVFKDNIQIVYANCLKLYFVLWNFKKRKKNQRKVFYELWIIIYANNLCKLMKVTQ